ncbi:MAG: glycosyltransferase [Alistipes sp.]|nr:glycosyltransferase [Alistipes sp.]
MSFFDNILLHYGWEGVALLGVTLLMLFVQLYYYIFVYGSIPSYKATRRQARLEKEPPVSIVIAMFSEDYDFVERRLPLFLAQEYSEYEVVVVYVGSDGDFYEDLQRIKQLFSQVVVTKIEFNPRFPISPKMALNVGIKSAHYEHIILSTTDVAPVSDKWVSLMAKGFTRGEVVLGYCGLDDEQEQEQEQAKGLGFSLMRTSRMMRSVKWLSSAIRRNPYRGIRHAVGFTKNHYFSTNNGFGFLNMNVGEDDLFLQKIMTKENVVAVLSPKAMLKEKCWGGMSWWLDQLRYYGATEHYYPSNVTSTSGWEMGSHILFILSLLTAMVVLPIELKVAAIVLLLIRVLVVLIEVGRIAKRLGESGVVGSYLIYDIWRPIESLLVRLMLLRHDSRVWR